MVLVDSNCCPVCGKSIAECVPSQASFETTGGRAYLQSAADLGGVNLDDLTKKMFGFLCSSCGAEFQNPWLDIESRNNIFVQGHPVHNSGWRRLVERVERGLLPDLNSDARDLLHAIESRVGVVNTYAELGCPFQGLLLHWTQEESFRTWSKKTRRFTSMKREQFHRFLPSMRAFMMLGIVATNMARYLMRLRNRRDRLRDRWQAPNSSDQRKPASIYFVPLQSSRFWGLNCSMFGDTCSAISREVSGSTVLPYEMFLGMAERHKFDLVGLFNVLDHQDDPIALLKRCISGARAVICTSHNAPFSQQHHFGLGAEFFNKLPDTIGNCEVVDFRVGEAGSDSMYLILPQS